MEAVETFFQRTGERQRLPGQLIDRDAYRSEQALELLAGAVSDSLKAIVSHLQH